MSPLCRGRKAVGQMDDPAGIVVGSGIAVGDCAGSRVNEYGLAFGYGAGGRRVELPAERDGSAGSLSVSPQPREGRRIAPVTVRSTKPMRAVPVLPAALKAAAVPVPVTAEVKAKAPAVSVPSEM